MKRRFVLLAGLCVPASAWAYLDPGAGSIMLQLILGGLAGVAVTARLYWHQLLAFFGLRRKRSATEADKTQSPE